ncbi:MAG: Pycsar system effector family protein [Chloroflexota bacterium]
MNKKEYYLAVLNRIDGMLSFAETKISFMLAYMGVLLATLGSQADGIKSLLQSTNRGVITTTLILLALIIVLLFCELYYLSKVLFPRLKFSKRTSMVYFSDISKLPEDKYLESMKKMKEEEIEVDLLSQIHAISYVTNEKFENIQIATYFLGCLTVLWLIMIIEIIIFSA